MPVCGPILKGGITRVQHTILYIIEISGVCFIYSIACMCNTVMYSKLIDSCIHTDSDDFHGVSVDGPLIDLIT